MLFDISLFRAPLPDGVRVFASGANQLAEINGFGRLGIPVGVSANHLNEAAILLTVEQTHFLVRDRGGLDQRRLHLVRRQNA
jgi:hypothetical protein